MTYSLKTMTHFEFIKIWSEMVIVGSEGGQIIDLRPNSNIIFGSIFEIGSPREATLTIQGSL